MPRKSRNRIKDQKQKEQSPAPEFNVENNSRIFYRPPIQIGAILILTAILYIPAIKVPWYFDDYYAVVDNRTIRSFAGIILHLQDFINRGFLLTTYAVDYLITDRLGLIARYSESGQPLVQHPYIFHFSNIIFHLLAISGVFFLTRKITHLLFPAGKNDSGIPANTEFSIFFPGIAALLFGIHPLHTEAVTYVAGRSSALASAEYIYGVFFFLIGLERGGFFDIQSKTPPQFLSRHNWPAMAAALSCFVLGIGTKEIIITMPVICILIASFVLATQASFHDALQRLKWFYATGALLVAVYFIYRYWMLGGIIGVDETAIRPKSINLLTQIGVIAFYYFPRQLLCGELCIDPIIPLIESFSDPLLWTGLGIIASVWVIAILTARRSPLILLGVIWYFITISPTSSIIPLNDLAAERRTYLPNAGFALALCGTIQLIELSFKNRLGKQGKSIVMAALACICVVAMFQTVQRNFLYANKTKFWQNTVETAPDNPRVLSHMAKRYVEIGKPKMAAEFYEKALDINPDNLSAFNNLGIIYLNNLKEYRKAAEIYARMLKMWPHSHEAWTNLGTSLLLLKDTERAKELAQLWSRGGPKSVNATLLLASAYYIEGDYKNAERLFLKALETDKTNTQALENLIKIANAEGDQQKAKGYMRRLNLGRELDSRQLRETDTKEIRIEAN